MSVALGAEFDILAEDPYDFYARARQQEPVTFCPDLNAWLVTRYEDIKSVLSQPEIFSASNSLFSYSISIYPQTLEELSKGYPPPAIAITSDGAEHRRLRAPLRKVFSSDRVKVLESFMREMANSLVDTFIEDRRVEIMEQFAYPFAAEAVHKLLGIPRLDIKQVRQWCQEWYALYTKKLDEEHQTAYAKSTVALLHYFADLIAERQATPQDDGISELVRFGPTGDQSLTQTELIYTLLLLQGGYTNPANLIGNGLRLLLEQPERWRIMREQPERIPQIVEEIVRFDGPIKIFARVTTQEVTLGGVTLPENTPLLIPFGSGSRDEAFCPHAGEFQVQRATTNHLGWGLGTHSCAAAALARLEGQMAFEVLGQRFPQLRLVPGQTFQRVPTPNFQGYAQLEVEWE